MPRHGATSKYRRADPSACRARGGSKDQPREGATDILAECAKGLRIIAEHVAAAERRDRSSPRRNRKAERAAQQATPDPRTRHKVTGNRSLGGAGEHATATGVVAEQLAAPGAPSKGGNALPEEGDGDEGGGGGVVVERKLGPSPTEQIATHGGAGNDASDGGAETCKSEAGVHLAGFDWGGGHVSTLAVTTQLTTQSRESEGATRIGAAATVAGDEGAEVIPNPKQSFGGQLVEQPVRKPCSVDAARTSEAHEALETIAQGAEETEIMDKDQEQARRPEGVEPGPQSVSAKGSPRARCLSTDCGSEPELTTMKLLPTHGRPPEPPSSRSNRWTARAPTADGTDVSGVSLEPQGWNEPVQRSA